MGEIGTLIIGVGLILLLKLLEFRNEKSINEIPNKSIKNEDSRLRDAESRRNISPKKNEKQIIINDSISKRYEKLERKAVLAARKAEYFSHEFTKSPRLTEVKCNEH